jgi:hypothetical protein
MRASISWRVVGGCWTLRLPSGCTVARLDDDDFCPLSFLLLQNILSWPTAKITTVRQKTVKELVGPRINIQM